MDIASDFVFVFAVKLFWALFRSVGSFFQGHLHCNGVENPAPNSSICACGSPCKTLLGFVRVIVNLSGDLSVNYALIDVDLHHTTCVDFVGVDFRLCLLYS